MADNYLPSVYQQYIYKSRYARYLDSESRRENWDETVARYFDYFETYLKENHNYDITKAEAGESFSARSVLEYAVLEQRVMPSMRALMTAGPALARDHIAAYNCAYQPMESLRSLDEELYILMNGTGDGFSVEARYVLQISELPEKFYNTDTTIVVADSKLGWAKAYRELLGLLSQGQIPRWDDSQVRPAGERLKTFGGRASGPEPLRDLYNFTVMIFKNAAGRKLTTMEIHDLGCMVANIVVVGGVRRSALISLSDIGDDLLRKAKSGAWWEKDGHRRLANNSAVYEEKPDIGLFMKEWLSLYDSKSGERGIFSRKAAKHVIEYSNEFRRKHFGPDVRVRDSNHDFGTNPCSEIILRPYEFCNLSEVVVRSTDTLETLKEKVRLATIIGKFQSCLTDFKYINKKWKKNCEDERLLGVSLTGIYDNELLNGSKGHAVLAPVLEELRRVAIETNIEWAKKLGINPSAAITCIKPSGTVSALNDTASGIHARNSPYYIRYVRNDIKDPLTQFLKDSGVAWETDSYDPANNIAFKFPMKSPEGAIFKKDLTAIAHLELWKLYQIHWCEHKPSVTISVKEHEWMEVGAWVYENFEWMSGVSFLPYADHVYKQAPFTDCSEEEYLALYNKTPKKISWESLAVYEKEDTTTGTQELACVAGGCEV